jgi:hypothetical protein
VKRIYFNSLGMFSSLTIEFEHSERFLVLVSKVTKHLYVISLGKCDTVGWDARGRMACPWHQLGTMKLALNRVSLHMYVHTFSLKVCVERARGKIHKKGVTISKN